MVQTITNSIVITLVQRPSTESLVFSIQSLVFSLQYLVFSLQSSVFSIQSLVFSIQYLVFGIWYLVFSIQYLVFSIQYFPSILTVSLIVERMLRNRFVYYPCTRKPFREQYEVTCFHFLDTHKKVVRYRYVVGEVCNSNKLNERLSKCGIVWYSVQCGI